MNITWPKMTSVVPEGSSGNVEVQHFEVSKREAEFTALRAAMNPDRDDFVPAGKYVRLLIGGETMMTDTPMEQHTNTRVVREAKGHVLIAGLGLGMILHPIAAKPEVTSITVVEKSPDVIKLVGTTVPEKVKLVEADIFDFKPPKGTRYDTIYFDIWFSVMGDNAEDMAKLHRKFAKYKAEGAWMHSWERARCLASRRRWRSIMGH